VAKEKILVQLDLDDHASVFDAVVAIDAGVDRLLQYSSVTPDRARSLVHGAMFTRGPKDLKHTAIFIGGSDIGAAEQLLGCVTECFFGPMSVSVMMDASGANTTASAAVLVAARHLTLSGATALVLGATGPVGQRVAWLLAREGAAVRLASRSIQRAQAACGRVGQRVESALLESVETSSAESTRRALDGADLVIAAGALGVELLPAEIRREAKGLRVAIDLNAVAPLGIEGVELADKAVEREGVICYGAIGVGGTKMKIHSAAIARLFQSNDQVLDTEQILAIGKELQS